MQKLKTIIIIHLLLFSCTLALSQTKNVDRRALLENKLIAAVTDYTTGEIAAATKAFTAIVTEDPSMDAAWYSLSQCQFSNRLIAKARESLANAVRLAPDNYWYRDRQALMELYLGNNNEAISLYEQMRKDFPSQPEILYTLANAYMRSGRLDEAVAVMDDIDREFGRSEGVARTRYELLMNLDRAEDALETLRQYNDQFASPDILSMMAEHYGMLGNDTLSVACYKEAISLQGDFLPALIGLAETYRNFGRDDEFFALSGELVSGEALQPEARRMFLKDLSENQTYYVRRNLPRVDSLMVKAVEAAPADSAIARTAGFYFARSGNMDKSAEIFHSIAEAYPQDSLAARTDIEVLIVQEKWKEASAAAADAFRRMPDKHFFLEMKNYADYKIKDYDALIANAEIMLSSPDVADRVSAYSSIGDIYHEKGDDKKAFAAYEKALKLDPGYVPVLNNYAYYLSVKGKNLKKAYTMSKKTVEAEPDNATYLDTFAWILHLQGKDFEAKPHLKHAMLYGGKDSAVILDHYAEVLYALGEYEMASLYWDQAKAKNDGEIPDLEERVAARLAAAGL